MKKQYALLFFFAALTNITHAQIFKYGARVGLSTSPSQAQSLAISGNTQQVLSSKFGLHAGLFMRLKLGPLYVQPEALLNSGTMEYTIEQAGTSIINTYNGSRYNLDLPVMVGMKAGPLRIQAGPIGSYTLSNWSELTDADVYYDAFTYGYQAGVGVDLLGKLILDLKYEGSVSGLGNGITVGGETYQFDTRPSRVVFSVGYAF